MSIRPWNQRSQEVANLFNPPFCCTLITATVGGFLQEDHRGMPLPLAYLALPAILHKNTRERLPPNTKTSLAAWMEENPDVKFQFYERAMAMKPFIGEGLIFGIHHNWLILETGNIKSLLNNLEINRIIAKSQGEAKNCMQRARFLGKWLALAGTTETIMALWEIRP